MEKNDSENKSKKIKKENNKKLKKKINPCKNIFVQIIFVRKCPFVQKCSFVYIRHLN